MNYEFEVLSLLFCGAMNGFSVHASTTAQTLHRKAKKKEKKMANLPAICIVQDSICS